MDDLFLARIAHVIGVVAWFGGVWFVTFVIMPAIVGHEPPNKRIASFHRIEGRFAPQAACWVLLTGASGFWMVWKMGIWWRFGVGAYWWMWAMVILWALFILILFLIEPLVIHPRLKRSGDDARSFRRLQVMHWILSLAGMLVIAAAVAGAHGWEP